MDIQTTPELSPAAVAAANRILPRLRRIVRDYGPAPYPASYTENTVSAAEVRHAADAPYGGGGGVLARANAATLLAFAADGDEAAERAAAYGVPAEAADAAAIPVYACRELHYSGVEFAPAFLMLAAAGTADPAEWNAAADAIEFPREAAARGAEVDPLECGHADGVAWMRGVAALFSAYRSAAEGSEAEEACGDLIEALLDSAREFARMLDALENYPVLDEEVLCSFEADDEAEAWNDGGALDFARAILARLDGTGWEELRAELAEWSPAELAESTALGLRHAEAASAAPWSFYTHESDGCHFDDARAAEFVPAADAATLAADLRAERGGKA